MNDLTTQEHVRSMDQVFHSDGDGLWSSTALAVKCTQLWLTVYEMDGDTWGELRVYFDTATWDITEHGLIYTDPQFISELRSYLQSAGYEGDVDYSEAGMQGRNYVSLDVYEEFVKSWMKQFA